MARASAARSRDPMTFAVAGEQWIPTRYELVAAIAETLRASALPLQWGGTNVAATGADDDARVENVLDTWGVTNGAGLFVDTRIPTALYLDKIYASDRATRILNIEHPNTPATTDSYGYVRSVQAGGNRFRWGTNGFAPTAAGNTRVDNGAGYSSGVSAMHIDGATTAPGVGDLFTFPNLATVYSVLTVTNVVGTDCDITFTPALAASVVDDDFLVFANDTSVDFQMETKGWGRVTHYGDPLPGTLKPIRRWTAVAQTALIDSIGMPAPIIRSPGAVQSSLVDANGHYFQVTYDGTATVNTANAVCGVHVASLIQRRHDPDLTIVGRTALLESRFWCGIFQTDPALTDAASLGSNKCVAFWFDQTVHTKLHLVINDGTTVTIVDTNDSLTANAIFGFSLKHVGSGLWRFAVYNFTTKTWTNIIHLTGGPGTSDTLGFYSTLTKIASSTTTSRAMAVKVVDLNAS